MTSKHTPGPWIWGDDYRGLYGAGPSNEVLEHAAYEGMWLGHGEAREANARLIAAAPDMLDTLKRAVAEAVADEMDPWFAEAKPPSPKLRRLDQ